ncbi:MAG: hypothetical protein K5894_09475 [Lachnospiraceae bacterium]|nr:hypothetical protein [Lachnospiraceae bacterium]
MINHRISAIFRITDSFTEKPIANGIFKAKLDGQSVKLLWKNDGYFLLMNAARGSHELEIESAIYLKEKIEIEVGEFPLTFVITLKAGENYPYGKDAKVFEGEAQGEYVWIVPVKKGMELKVAESEAKAGVKTVAVFVPASMTKHLYPDNFIVMDGEASEMICIEDIENGRASLSMNLKNPHKRGTKILHAEKFEINDGKYRAVFKDAEKIEVF